MRCCLRSSTACSGVPATRLRRAFTSTNTKVPLSIATRSISAPDARKFRATTRKPHHHRCRAATPSHRAPYVSPRPVHGRESRTHSATRCSVLKTRRLARACAPIPTKLDAPSRPRKQRRGRFRVTLRYRETSSSVPVRPKGPWPSGRELVGWCSEYR